MTLSKLLTLGLITLFIAGCTTQTSLETKKAKPKTKPKTHTKSKPASSSKLEMHGFPGWLADGAKIQKEPKPVAPVPGFVPLQRESGPVRFEMELGKTAQENAKRKPSKRNLKIKEQYSR